MIGRNSGLPHTMDSSLTIASDELFSKVADTLIKALEKQWNHDPITFSPILFLRMWMSTTGAFNLIETDLNAALRESKHFKKARFLFTGQKASLN